MEEIETVRVDWVSEQTFVLRDRNEFPIVMSQPNGVNAADLLALSLIGCASYDIVSIMRKQRQKMTAFSAAAVVEKEGERPERFRKICITYRFTGEGLEQEKVARAVRLSESKYCSIFATLERAVEIESKYEIVEG